MGDAVGAPAETYRPNAWLRLRLTVGLCCGGHQIGAKSGDELLDQTVSFWWVVAGGERNDKPCCLQDEYSVDRRHIVSLVKISICEDNSL